MVVLGAAADQVRETADLSRATVVINRAWGTGVGSSIRAGLAALDDEGIEAVVVVPVDMPGLTVAAVRRVTALPYPDVLVCATYDGLRGYPMLFGRRHWSGIATLASADVGARPYLLAHKDQIVDIACDSVADGSRVDTPELMALYGLTVPPQRVGVLVNGANRRLNGSQGTGTAPLGSIRNGRPCTSNRMPPKISRHSAHTTRARWPVPASSRTVATRALRRSPTVVSFNWISPLIDPWVADITFAMTLGLVEKVSALACIQAARKRPPGNADNAGDLQVIPPAPLIPIGTSRSLPSALNRCASTLLVGRPRSLGLPARRCATANPSSTKVVAIPPTKPNRFGLSSSLRGMP